jgi:hypothetical protein
MKPEPPPERSLVSEANDAQAGSKCVVPDEVSSGEGAGNSYDISADGFHGKALPEKTVTNNTGEAPLEECNETFITALKEDVGPKKMLSREDEDLGIYEDTDVNGEDDLSDTELELERLREEKRKRELEEKDRQRAEEKQKQQAAELVNASRDVEERRQAEITRNVRSLTDSAIKQIEKQLITPRTDVSLDSRISSKSWSDPRFLQGISIRDVGWKTDGDIVPVTNMKTEILQSR